MANPIVTIEMESGAVMSGELYPEIAPNTVNNFIALANSGFYDGVVFHRVIPGFMIQGGDPDGNGTGGPGYEIKGEFSANGFKNDLKHTLGVLSMARTMIPDSAGSQFFIMVADAPHLDGQYAAFGKITENAQAAVDISRVNRNMYNDMPKSHRSSRPSAWIRRALTIPSRRRCNFISFCFRIPDGFPVFAAHLSCAAHTGAYRFRRGCGGRISGQRRLASIKRVTYKLKNNNEVALAA